MAQWVKNLTAVAPVTAEAQVQFPALRSGLKDPALPQLQVDHSGWDSVPGPYASGEAIKLKK